jgi:hypothetical protein
MKRARKNHNEHLYTGSALDVGQQPWQWRYSVGAGGPHILLDKGHIRQMNEAKMSVGSATQIIFLFAEYDTYVQNLSESQFRRACTEDLFRAETVELVRTSNKSIPEIAFELGISDQTLRD